MRSTPSNNDPSQQEAPRTLIDSACRRLARDIVEGRHAPGERLRIEPLKQMYQVSGSTLREALSLLVSQQLVETEEQRGFRVAPMSMDDLEDLTRVRVTLECAALVESILHGDDDWEAQLVSAWHKLSLAEKRLPLQGESSFDEWERRNAEFHEALLAGCHSRWLHRFRRTLYQQLERYRRLLALRGAPSRPVHDEHAEIFQATIGRDALRATAALAGHIQKTLELARSLELLKAKPEAAG
jgi:GntR family transcriptional regulator, carbon starvation induced regulator